MPAYRLLIVDDEASVLGLLRRYLEKLGHAVDTALTAREALGLFDRGAYDLVIADLQLPDLNGEEMVRRMRHKNPRLQALIASGFPSMIAGESDSGAGQRFIQKPFLPVKLAELIEEILSSAARETA